MKRTTGNRVILASGFLLLGICAFIGGFTYHQQTARPIIETRIEYVDRYVEVEKIIEVEVPLELRQFSSVDELKDCLAQDDTDTTFYFYETTVLPYDCDDYAEALYRHALKAGFYMSKEIDIKEGKYHMLNSTIIGTEIYFIEPQTGEMWLWGYTD